MTFFLVALLALVQPDPGAISGASTGYDSVAQQIDKSIDAGKLADAVALAVKSCKTGDSGATTGFEKITPRLLASLVKLARACETSGDSAHAATVYHLAAASVVQPTEELKASLDVGRRRGLWIAAAKRLDAEARPIDGLRWLTAASDLAAVNDADAAWKPAIGDEALRCGAGLIDIQNFETAAAAYRLAIKNLDPQKSDTAKLGLAWSLTLAGTDDLAAIDAVESFIKEHSQHVDVPSAMLLRITLATRRNDVATIRKTRLELVKQFPDSDATIQAVIAGVDSTQWNEWLRAESGDPIARFLADQHARIVTRCGSRSVVLASGLVAAIGVNRPDAELIFGDALATNGLETGAIAAEAVSVVLEKLVNADHADAAQRLAKRWLEREPGGHVSLAVAEASGRWAGRSARWEMLAEVASTQSPLANVKAGDSVEPSRLHIARLYAESLLQAGRGEESLRWWEAIVDRGGAKDFATLLRLAEATVASGTTAQASVRLAAVRAISRPDSTQPSLVNLLAADIEIRQLQFDRGRALLESVVRSAQSDSELRGRAQWTLGESYFMQGKYNEAIDAYRVVEGMTDDPRWVAASLVQAGKSFEQLGRTREAALCYGTLVSRYGESTHATNARHRLAALQPDGTEPTGVIRR